VQRALKDEPIQICGTGKQTRCFCYVADLVEAVIGLMNCEHADGKVYNIGSSEEISIEKLADKIIKMTGSKSQKRFVPYELVYGRPIDDMMRRVPDLERIKETIGWESKTPLDEILQVIADSLKFSSGIFYFELPVHASLFFIGIRSPCTRFIFQHINICHSSILQALSRH